MVDSNKEAQIRRRIENIKNSSDSSRYADTTDTADALEEDYKFIGYSTQQAQQAAANTFEYDNVTK